MVTSRVNPAQKDTFLYIANCAGVVRASLTRGITPPLSPQSLLLSARSPPILCSHSRLSRPLRSPQLRVHSQYLHGLGGVCAFHLLRLSVGAVQLARLVVGGGGLLPVPVVGALFEPHHQTHPEQLVGRGPRRSLPLVSRQQSVQGTERAEVSGGGGSDQLTELTLRGGTGGGRPTHWTARRGRSGRHCRAERGDRRPAPAPATSPAPAAPPAAPYWYRLLVRHRLHLDVQLHLRHVVPAVGGEGDADSRGDTEPGRHAETIRTQRHRETQRAVVTLARETQRYSETQTAVVIQARETLR